MEKQVVDMGAVVRGFVAYAESSETIERAQSIRVESRKIVAEFIRTNKGTEWKRIQKPIKAAIDGIAVGIVKDKVGMLGVVKTCIEYSIMPTTLNADRLRKAKTWTTLEGKIVPNGYSKVHAPKPETPAATMATTATTAPAPTQTIPEAASAKPVAAQKTAAKGDIPRPNISSSDEPLSPREHCAILLDQLFKNESFRSEFAPILATMLDSNVGIVTRCLVESRDLFCKGGK